VRTVAGLSKICVVSVVAAVALCGCVTTIHGSAMATSGKNPGPAAPALTESQLDNILLSVDDATSIVGGSTMKEKESSKDMVDDADTVDNKDCLGVVDGAEKQVYDGTDWQAVRYKILTQPASDTNGHWVQQIVVLFPTAKKATNFFEKSRSEWKNCAQTSVNITNPGGDNSSTFNVGRVNDSTEALLTAELIVQNGNGWTCQHSMGLVSNVVVEAFACGRNINDEAERIVKQIVENAANQ
jgi:hypothetical protein